MVKLSHTIKAHDDFFFCFLHVFHHQKGFIIRRVIWYQLHARMFTRGMFEDSEIVTVMSRQWQYLSFFLLSYVGGGLGDLDLLG